MSVAALLIDIAVLVMNLEQQSHAYAVQSLETMGDALRQLHVRGWELQRDMTSILASMIDTRHIATMDAIEVVNATTEKMNNTLNMVIYPKIASIDETVKENNALLKSIPESIAALPSQLAAEFEIIFESSTGQITSTMRANTATLTATMLEQTDRINSTIEALGGVTKEAIERLTSTVDDSLTRFRDDLKRAMDEQSVMLVTAIDRQTDKTQRELDRLNDQFVILTDATAEFYMTFWDKARETFNLIMTVSDADIAKSMVSLFKAQEIAMAEIAKVKGG